MRIFDWQLSFYRKQMLMGIAINAVSLLILGLVMYQIFFKEYRNELLNSAQTKSNMIVSSIASALVFDDVDSANVILNSLEGPSDFRYAQIFYPDGNLFSEYKIQPNLNTHSVKDLNTLAGLPFGEDNVREVNDEVISIQRVLFDGETVGHLVLSFDANDFQAQTRRIKWAIFISIGLTSFIAFAFSLRTQHYLGKPIGELDTLARYVVENKKYDRRIELVRDNDVGRLINAVNQMLDTIEQQQNAAALHAEELESLVDLRTKQLFDRANYDSLTRLPNRHLLTEYLENSMADADKKESSVAVLFLDLNRFKVINDSLGHAVGDKLLKIIGYKLCYILRKVECVSRWGGDEFVIVVKDVSSYEEVESICNRIIETVNEPTVVDEHQLHVSTSIGVAMYPEHGDNSTDLLKFADSSMYVAKRTGGGSYCFFNKVMLKQSITRLSMEAEVRAAVNNRDFYLVFQPQLDVARNTIGCVEALSRWEKDGEFISPDRFVPVIEELGLMLNFTTWVVQEACATVRSWIDRGEQPIPIAINLSPSVLVLPACMEMILDEIDKHGIDPKYLQVEITESSFVDSTDLVHVNLLSLRDRGIEVAMDDFGTGYSCLSYLRDLPINKLKIDGSFVRKMEEDGVSAGVVKAIIVMAKTLNLELVAECVETEAQLEFLALNGVDFVQGYLFCKPLRDDELWAFVSSLEDAKTQIQ